MIRHTVIILTLFNTACKQNSHLDARNRMEKNRPTNDSLNEYSITKATADDFNKAKKAFINKTDYYTKKIKKVNGKIILPVEEKLVSFTDTLLDTDNSDIRQYEYIGQFSEIGFYIIKGVFWEHLEYYLIDTRTGKQTTIWNSPSLSPNNKFIANLSMPYGFEGVPNGIQVWRIEKNIDYLKGSNSVSNYLEIDQQIWTPLDFVWDSDNAIILKVIDIEKFVKNPEQTNNNAYFIRMRLK